MRLGNTNSSPQHNDNPRSQRSARDYLEFIIKNLTELDNVRNGAKYKQDAIRLSVQRHNFTNKQLSYIDVIYEKVMKGMGLPSFQTTYKPQRRYV